MSSFFPLQMLIYQANYEQNAAKLLIILRLINLEAESLVGALKDWKSRVSFAVWLSITLSFPAYATAVYFYSDQSIALSGLSHKVLFPGQGRMTSVFFYMPYFVLYCHITWVAESAFNLGRGEGASYNLVFTSTLKTGLTLHKINALWVFWLPTAWH